MPIKAIELSNLVVDGGTDVRSEINEDIVNEYSEAARKKAKFPPLIVFDTGEEMLVADGFHRLCGFERQGVKKYDCDIRKGTKADALKFALGCNDEHGYRRTNADKRNAVIIALKEFDDSSDRTISEMCKVSHTFVGDIRKEIAPPPPPRPVVTSGVPAATNTEPPPRRKGKDGKNYKASKVTSNIPPRPAPAVAVTMDATNHPVPEEIIPAWDQALEESKQLLQTISETRSRLKRALDFNEPMFRELNHNDAIAKLDLVYAELKLAKPYAVCMECQGVLTSVITNQGQVVCRSCKGKGWVSQQFWDNCVPTDAKKAAGRE